MAYTLLETINEGTYLNNDGGSAVVKVEVWLQQDLINNTSDVNVKVYCDVSSASYDYDIPSDMSIAGTSFHEHVSFTGNGSFKLMWQNTKTGIAHETDGTKSISITAFMDTGSTAIKDITLSKTVTLTTIPRASVIGTISAFNLEDSFSVPLTKYSETFTDTLVIKQGETTIKTITEYTSETAINLTEAELLTAYGTVSDLTATFTFETTTLSGETTIGTDSETATGTVAGTGYIKVSGTWKRCVPHIKVSGVWKKAVLNTNVSGTWKRGIG